MVKFNEICEKYSESHVIVNPNVCAKIEMEFPDYNNKKGPIYD